MDATDRAILSELADDARLSMSDLAERVSLSRAHAYRRVEALRVAGVLRGFTIDVDYKLAELSVGAVVLVETVQDRWEAVHEMVRAMPGVQYAAATTGGYDMALIVRAESVDELRETVLGRLALDEGVRSTRTLVVLEEIQSIRVVLPSP